MFIKRIFILLIIITLFIPGLCFADDFLEENNLDNFLEVSNNSENTKKEPITNSKHIVAIDRKSLNILYEKSAYKKTPMASTTKIMTAIIVLENCNLNETVEISKKAASTQGSTLGISTGDKISMNDLLYGLMLRSGNDCAIAIAEYISGSVEEFANLMNEKAKELNLTNTHFVTPHGLDDKNHYTTAYELALLTDYALKNKTFQNIVSTKTATISINGISRTISNTNELLGNLSGVYGVKTGFTFNAGRCLVSSCNRNGMDIIVVVLGADTKNQRTQDSIKIINYIYNNFEYVNIENYINQSFEKYQEYFDENINLYKTTTKPIIKLSKIDNYTFPLKQNSANTIKTKFYGINTISSNIQKNSKIGQMSILYEKNILCTIDIILTNEIKANSWYYYFFKILKGYRVNN